MIPKSLVRTVVLISLGMGCLLSANAEEVRDACGQIALPSGVQKALRARFPGWKIETLADLDLHGRELWLKVHPTECPGLAVGRFRNTMEASYAVLLLATHPERPGYKLVEISRVPGGKYETTVLEQAKWQIAAGSDVVVNKVPPGDYADPEDNKHVRLTLDGVVSETLEKGAMLYYWRGGRFRELIISE